MAIVDFTSGKWDTDDVVLTWDGYQPQLYGSSDMYTASYDNDNVTITPDVKGNTIVVVHHNKLASLTINISALDELWGKLVESYNPTDTHVVDIMTPAEHLHSDSVYLPRLPEMPSGADAPVRALACKCAQLTIGKP